VEATVSFFLLERENKKIKYASVGHAIKAAVEELNPLLGDCEIVDKTVAELDDEFFASYDMVVASQLSMTEAARVAQATTAGAASFFW
jgi:hypothetical protein